MKKIMVGFLVLFVILSGCSDKKDVKPPKKIEKELTFAQKQKSVSVFINEDVYAIAEVQLKAFDSLQQVMDEQQPADEQKIYKTIVNETIPAFEKAGELTKDIKIKFSELETPRKFLLDSIEAYKEGLELRAKSIEEGRQDLKRTSEARFVEYGQLFKQYNKSINEIANDFKVSYKPIEMIENQDLNKFKVKQDRIISFINEDAERVNAYENQAKDFMDAVTGENFTDEETEYEVIINKAIPAHEKALNEAENINPIIEELKQPQQTLVKATETVLEFNQKKVESIEKHDKKIKQQAADLYEKYEKEIALYHKQVGKIAKKFDIVYDPDSEGLKASKKHP